MTLQSRPQSLPWGAIFFSLLGLAWCGYVAFPSSGDPSCITSGCEVTRLFTIGKISLWWIGGGYFFILTVLCLRHMRYFAWRLAQVALLLDAFLLLLMFITGPCYDCLVVAVFFFLTALILRAGLGGWFQNMPRGAVALFPVWIGLFLGNVAVALNETVPHWTVGTQTQSNVRVYFAPSCPACRDAVKTLGATSLLYPVLEKEDDFEALLRFESALADGKSMAEAIELCLDKNMPTPKISVLHSSILRIQLMRNKAFFLKHHFRAMPLIEISGMPREWIQEPPLVKRNGTASQVNPVPNQNIGNVQGIEDQSSTLPEGLGNDSGLFGEDGFKQCTEGAAEPCDE